MNSIIRKRIIDEAIYYVKNNSTIRKTAENFNVSKSTVHVDMSKKLKKLDKFKCKQYYHNKPKMQIYLKMINLISLHIKKKK